jgi:hypothetical protein
MGYSFRLALAALALWGSAAVGQEAQSACIVCHSNEDYFDEEQLTLVADFLGSRHAEVGLSCHDCHGGNPDPALSDDMDLSMDEDFEERPYRGAPARPDIPSTCGGCHSDPTYMRGFDPDARVDQEREYWTSRHGIALLDGDTRVATCVDCHGGHAIRRPGDPESTVHPQRVAETCGRCHSDAERMAGYAMEDGRPLPTDQLGTWRRSVHAEALLDREDLSAPTCNDCHGNHGAQPPGLESIAYVCGQCHGREASLFRESPKKALWEEHNEFLADVEFESCTACHAEPEPQSSITTVHHFAECGSCHGNHGIVRPTLAFFAPFETTPCAFCHEALEAPDGEEPGMVASEIGEPATSAASEQESALAVPADWQLGEEEISAAYRELRDALIEEARELGLSSEQRFNWLVDRSLALAAHGAGEEGSERGESETRNRFMRLFERFRIGKTYYEYEPEDGPEPVRIDLQRCTWCHAEASTGTDESEGHRVGQRMARQAIGLMALTARAERALSAARRGGIELRESRLDVERAVDTQIDLQVLAHRFRTDGEFAEAVAEGRRFAEAAIRAGEEAQGELRYRRLGLLVFLGFVVCVLIGLGLKIRLT